MNVKLLVGIISGESMFDKMSKCHWDEKDFKVASTVEHGKNENA